MNLKTRLKQLEIQLQNRNTDTLVIAHILSDKTVDIQACVHFDGKENHKLLNQLSSCESAEELNRCAKDKKVKLIAIAAKSFKGE